MKQVRYLLCKHCHNLVQVVQDAGVPIVCCGEPMTELVPNSTDAAGEKHVPVVSRDGNRVHVNVGSVAHPMGEDHHIAWVALVTKQGVTLKYLTPDQAPEAACGTAFRFSVPPAHKKTGKCPGSACSDWPGISLFSVFTLSRVN